VREKDGLWAILCWLSILEWRNRDVPVGELVGVDVIMRQHWQRFGRNFYTRYDYENVDAAQAAAMMEHIRSLAASPPPLDGFSIASIDDFTYTDPVDGSVASKQGLRVLFADSSRIVLRLSGTGSVGATVRIYIERYQPPDDAAALEADSGDALAPLVALALDLSRVKEFTGRDAPTVIT